MDHIFGPVPSRRLGYSLGVDLVSPKTCSFDCIYCECGPTTLLTSERKEYVPFAVLAEEIGEFFKSPPKRLDYVTLSGSGEPCLNVRMGDVLELLRSVSPAPIAVLTNSSLLTDPGVRDELSLAQVVAPSLDTAREETFRRVNRGHPSFTVRAIVEGLAEFCRSFTGEVRLEVLLVKGVNDSPEELRLLKREIERIGPDMVDVNTVFRPGTAKVAGLTGEELKAAALALGPTARPVGSFLAGGAHSPSMHLKKRVIALISRRPCTEPEIAASLGAGPQEVEKVLHSLREEGSLSVEERPEGRFLRWTGSGGKP